MVRQKLTTQRRHSTSEIEGRVRWLKGTTRLLEAVATVDLRNSTGMQSKAVPFLHCRILAYLGIWWTEYCRPRKVDDVVVVVIERLVFAVVVGGPETVWRPDVEIRFWNATELVANGSCF